MRRFAILLAAAALAVIPAAASAHVGVGDAHGFVHGFWHPLSGIDHILVMIAVGMLAVQIGGRALWLLPLTFLAAMTAGGALGMAGLAVPFVETGIGLSVVVLGLAVAFRLAVSTIAAVAVIAVFAVFHGHAHAAEMPETASGIAYGLGFLCATALLHAFGLGMGLSVATVQKPIAMRASRVAGLLMACVGVGLLAGAI